MAISVAVTRAEWAIDPEAAGDVQRAIDRMNGAIERVGWDALEARWLAADAARRGDPARPSAPWASPVPGVAVIPVEGVLLPKAPGWAAEYGIGSTSAIAATVRAAAADPAVEAIVLAIDSPGGDVRGVEEAADAIATASAIKPTTAVIEYMGASAAYWLAAQAREIVMPASAVAGSIGVITTRLDATEAIAREGLKVHVTTAGPHKAEGHPATVQSDAERDARQQRVAALYTAFVDGVARGRRVPAADVEARFGGGRTFYGRDAVARGLADRVGSLGDVLTGLRRMAPASGDRSLGDPFAERASIAAELLRVQASALAGV